MDLENDKQVEAVLNMTLGWPYCVQSVFTIKGMFKISMSMSSGKRFLSTLKLILKLEGC